MKTTFSVEFVIGFLGARTYLFFPMVLLISNSYERTKQIESTSLVLRLEIFSFSISSAFSFRQNLTRKVNGFETN